MSRATEITTSRRGDVTNARDKQTVLCPLLMISCLQLQQLRPPYWAKWAWNVSIFVTVIMDPLPNLWFLLPVFCNCKLVCKWWINLPSLRKQLCYLWIVGSKARFRLRTWHEPNGIKILSGPKLFRSAELIHSPRLIQPNLIKNNKKNYKIRFNNVCLWFGSCEDRRLNESRSKAVIPGWARREERLSRSKFNKPVRIDSDAVLHMNLI